jgi:hypothetical protein
MPNPSEDPWGFLAAATAELKAARHRLEERLNSQPSSSLAELREYLAWLERWSDGETPSRPCTPRPQLTLIEGGRDA